MAMKELLAILCFSFVIQMQHSLFHSNNNILPFNGEVILLPGFFPKTESDIYFNQLLNETQWKQEPIKIFGKSVMQPRLTAWYADENKNCVYSGIVMKPVAWTETLLSIKQKAEKASGFQFNSVLLNQYRNGHDSMGWHRDNEKELGVNPVIASVSFGATRTFQLRDYKNKKPVQSIELTHGSMLLMKGETQHHWEHQLPKTKLPKGIRINLTFRNIL